MNVTFNELSVMAFEQHSSKPGLQSMTSGQISLGLYLTYTPSTITTQKPTERELDLLFEAIYNDYIGGQPSATPRTVLAAQAPQVLHTQTSSTTIADTTPTPTNSSSQATNIPNTSQDVDELKTQHQHVHQQDNKASLQPKIVANNVSNTMLDGNTFVKPFTTPSISAAESSSLQYVDPSNMHTHYEENTIIRNKTRLVVRGYRQEEGIDFEESFAHAPRAWYDELSKFLLHNHFFRSTIDPTLFIRRFDDDILVVQVYVDDIIFGSTNPRYGMETFDPIGTLIEIKDKLDLDQNGTLVDAMKYPSMIGTIMYLTSSRSNIIHATYLCARYQDVDYAGCKDTFKSTSNEAQFLGEKLPRWGFDPRKLLYYVPVLLIRFLFYLSEENLELVASCGY
nr:hypothetical protein [Tanacetum cinerariifolium]